MCIHRYLLRSAPDSYDRILKERHGIMNNVPYSDCLLRGAISICGLRCGWSTRRSGGVNRVRA